MKNIGVIANCTKSHADVVLRKLGEEARRTGISLSAAEPAAGFLGCDAAADVGQMLDSVEGIIALGGDGTMLAAVRALDGRDKPVIGVNIGGLGFLTSVAEEEMDRALECLAEDDFDVSVRAIADCMVMSKGKEQERYRALNDVVVNRGTSSRIVTLDVAVDGDRVTSYVCDGLIVSTPTGSTGHSLSAGGPILCPETGAFVICLICPHTLSSRPLVVPDTSEVVIAGGADSSGLLLSVDGQVGREILPGESIRVIRSEKDVRFIHLPGHSHFAVLRQKLHWSGSSVTPL
jgi:NAD+ kinase